MRLCFKSKVKEQLITVFVVANAQKQGEQVIKRLITVFDEAMSHDASIARRVYRAEAVRHISGRAPARAECIEVGYATMFQVINVKARILIYWYLNINKEGNRDNEKEHQRYG